MAPKVVGLLSPGDMGHVVGQVLEENGMRVEGMLPAMPTKARRWVGEMEEIARTFADLGMTPRIYQGAADMYRLVSETQLADETPENRDASRTLARTIEMLAAHLAGKQ